MCPGMMPILHAPGVITPGQLGPINRPFLPVITRRTRTIVFISCELVCGKRTLMVGTGVWKIPPTAE